MTHTKSVLETIFKYKEPERDSLVPTFFVGLGGAGGAMVDRILHKLTTRWDQGKFRGLYHGFALDTDVAALERLAHIPKQQRMLLSDFSKSWYVAGKRGESYVPADAHVAQWAHDWYRFRTEVGAGAGQIRLESRLCLHYQLERGEGIISRFQRALDEALLHDNPYRRRALAQVNVFVFGSVAGGTGSGALLPITYLLKHLASQRNQQAKTYGCVILPGAFADEVPGCQREDIDANGYAALMEIEHLMRLGLSAGDSPSSVTFHFSGFHRNETVVREPPFNFLYVLDKPQGFTTRNLAELRDAVADAMFLQFFSPTADTQASGWDNMIKRVIGGTGLRFVLNYGTYGASALILPDRDILEYCARRFALDALDRFVLQQAAATEDSAAAVRRRASIDPTSEEFALLSPEDQGRTLDAAFVTFVDGMAADEERRKLRGPFTSTKVMLSASTGAPLKDLLDDTVAHFLDITYGAIQLTRLPSQAVSTANKDVAGQVDRLRQQVEASRRSMSDALREPLARIRDGSTLREIFVAHKIRPLGQRYFLIRILEGLRERETHLRRRLTEERASLAMEGDAIDGTKQHWQSLLDKTAPRTLWERLRGHNADFNEARDGYVRWFNDGLRDPWQSHLRAVAEHALISELLKRIDLSLQTFRDFAGQAATSRERLAHETEHQRRVGGVSPESSEANLYALDIEVLRDEATGERLWDRYYGHAFGKDPALFDPDSIIEVIDDAFGEVDDRGRLREPRGDEVASRLVLGLIELGRNKLSPLICGAELTDQRALAGLLIDDALELEARFVRGAHTGGEVEADELERYILAKLTHAAHKASPLGLQAPPAPNQEIRPSEFVIACAHPIYGGDGGLGGRIQRVTHAAGVNTGWDDHKLILFYSATLGIPLYWFGGVRDRMRDAYYKVRRERVETRSYPLHIDKHWELALGDLDPSARAEQDEAKRQEVDHVSFAFCVSARVIERRDDGTWRFTLGALDEVMGASFADAFKWFSNRPQRVRDRIDAELAELRAHVESQNEPAESWDELSAHLVFLADLQLALSDSAPETEQWRALSRYVRAHAPSEVVDKLAKSLAR